MVNNKMELTFIHNLIIMKINSIFTSFVLEYLIVIVSPCVSQDEQMKCSPSCPPTINCLQLFLLRIVKLQVCEGTKMQLLYIGTSKGIPIHQNHNTLSTIDSTIIFFFFTR